NWRALVMQHMPDKDFDQLFKDSFVDAEVQPSADLWGNIAEQLEPKKKRTFPVFWMAAASVVAIASVMLFTQDSEKIYLQGATVETTAVNPSNNSQKISELANEEVVIEVSPKAN